MIGARSRRFAAPLVAASTFLSAAAASAQLIRPDAATATSEHSSPYRVVNAINGSGLPSGFGLADPHATYAGGNHWTTASGRTIGESATFTFNEPQTLGGIHMWAHRSNSIASNPFYEVTLFDLVLFDGPDGAGAELARFTNIVGIPDLATAQTHAFTITSGVRSVRFIIRATQNANASPFTGLAEVAFTPCVAPATGDAPSSVSACPNGEVAITSAVSGSGPFTSQWQVEIGGVWEDLADGELFISDQRVGVVTGSGGPSLTLGGFSTGPGSSVYTAPVLLRLNASNACGAAASSVITLTICPPDFNCDGTRNPDDLGDFITCYFSEPPCPEADFNADGDTNPDDLGDYITAFFAGCCGIL